MAGGEIEEVLADRAQFVCHELACGICRAIILGGKLLEGAVHGLERFAIQHLLTREKRRDLVLHDEMESLRLFGRKLVRAIGYIGESGLERLIDWSTNLSE